MCYFVVLWKIAKACRNDVFRVRVDVVVVVVSLYRTRTGSETPSANIRFFGAMSSNGCRGSLQKVQGHRTAQGHRAGVNADLTSSTGGPVGHACR